MTNENQFTLSDHDEATKTLTEAVTGKIQYLQTLVKAIDDQDDRQVYELINSKKYSDEILHARHGAQDTEN